MSIIKLQNVSKYYYNRNNITSGFSKVNLTLEEGEFVAITGESGSGKSTLLNVISGLDSYEDGEMYINGKETSHFNEKDYEDYRRKYIGNIFQNFNLVNSYTVYQNIELVLLLNGYKKRDIKKRILDIIDKVGLTKFKNTKAAKLSGGQKQRVAIARALVKDTPIIVADEPTGNLDVESARSILALLNKIAEDKLVIIVTHNYEQIEKYATRKITMSDGRIIEDKKLKKDKKVEIKPMKYKNIRFFNKIFLGLKNVFNIKIKFVLLFIVYFFLTFLVFAGYSNIQKMNYEDNMAGENSMFIDTSVNRVILKKIDNSEFSDEDINKLSSFNNIKEVIKNDLEIDKEFSLLPSDNNAGYNAFGFVKDYSTINQVDEGRLPQGDNEVVIKLNELSYNIVKKYMMEELYNGDYYLDEYPEKLKVVGLIVNRSDDASYYDTIYISPKLISRIRKERYEESNIYLSFNDKTYIKNSENETRLYFDIKPNDNVSPGEAIIGYNYNNLCHNKWCLTDTFNIKVKNMYYEEEVNVIVRKEYMNKYDFHNLLNLPYDQYENNTDTVYISNNDYDRLFDKGSYQASVYLKDIDKLDETIDILKSNGYKTYPMKNMLVDYTGDLKDLFRVIRTTMFIISIFCLFFISYFIIKLILKSRNTYFSCIRILGANKKVSKDLLRIELLSDINIAFITFIGLIILCKMDFININYINSLIKFLSIKDYVVVYIILIFMSLLISNRYARQLFTQSALETYREEI